MTRTRRSLAALAVICGSVLLAAGPATAKRDPGTSAPPAPAPAPAPASLPAPTNLRLIAVAPTSVSFAWDSVVVGQPGCSFPYVFFHVYDDAAFLTTTSWLGPPTQQQINGLTPGTTHLFQVQARDNCTGTLSPLSEPLVITTPVG
jgi:hypothetical protein